MDSYSSGGEDLVIKTRKPYTITKQRERWTEEEHNRFLEALKLYGRAWQRIEEHIGTKTAVQIRSHAQKFFTKLEKEAVAKGVPIGQALDIEIPPPRPKRKPSNPYPRKTSIGPSTSQSGTKDGKPLASAPSSRCKQVLDFEKEPCSEKSSGDERATDANKSHNNNCSGVFSPLEEAHCPSVSSVNKNPESKTEVLRKSCTFREFMPSMKNGVNHKAPNELCVSIDLEQEQKLNKADTRGIAHDNRTSEVSKTENDWHQHEKLVQSKKSEECTGCSQSYPRHVPIHILDGSLGNSPPSNMSFQDSIYNPVGEVHAHLNLCSHPAASTTTESQNNVPSSSRQPFPSLLPPIAPAHCHQDDYRNFLHMSSTFSSLIVSALLQNPAAHAAASFAATYWPYANVESSDSPSCSQGVFPPRQSAPSMAALAAATVAAATAWWAAHGLLPLCVPPHAAFARTPATATAFRSADTGEVTEAKSERKETSMNEAPLQDKQLDPEPSEDIQAEHSAAKLPAMSSSDTEESAGAKPNGVLKDKDCEITPTPPEIHDSGKTRSKKQVDRSSCGSNTPSSSDVETDALEKQEKSNEEAKETDANHPVAESSGRRGRIDTNMNDSWKEVSEEGRLAFQALFSREILPQSFSPPHDAQKNQKVNNEENKHNTGVKDGDTSMLDLTNKRCRSLSDRQAAENNASPQPEGKGEEGGLLTLALGPGKLKARRTGFKPYRRCAAEAENLVASNSGQAEEREPKRVRLEGAAST